MIRLIVNRELPILLVDSPEFRELLSWINPAVAPILSKQTAVTDGIIAQFRLARIHLSHTLSSVDHISITCDAWTSPSSVPMLGITAHWLTEEFAMKSVVLALKEIDGSHTGKNMASLVKHTLDSFNLTSKLYCITADNASNNLTMGRELHNLIPHFDHEKNLHGCVAHVINLVAKAGISIFDSKTPPDPLSALDPQLPQDNEPLPSSLIEPTPHLEVHSILTRIRGFHKRVRLSTQLKQALDQSIATSSHPRKVGLIHEVSTRWSSTFYSLERYFELKKVLQYYCNINDTLEPYLLTEDEWTLVGNIVKFLRPLAIVIKEIEGDDYPTFSRAMPDYQWLVEKLEKVSFSFHSFHIDLLMMIQSLTVFDFYRT